ncbi:hypothetical protein CBE01nite_19680 [Clostridium beijerinckii]|nr:hypothetical protein CBE01nite_19680 [Clostridium beijerinckii]
MSAFKSSLLNQSSYSLEISIIPSASKYFSMKSLIKFLWQLIQFSHSSKSKNIGINIKIKF